VSSDGDVPQWIRLLPHLNASLNAVSAVFLLRGYRFIRLRQKARHRVAMLSALVASVLFLASYLTYHLSPGVGTVRFVEPTWARPVYLVILVPHVILAGAVLPMALVTVGLALRGRFPRHRRVARVTLPVWLYVSVTGVLVYLMLYVVFPQR
jgi:uncharacterized membrane protein YozB (DUF420 family)